MHFIGEFAEIQQRLAQTRAVAERRRAVVEMLAPHRGERILEIGCGAGLLLREIGLALGPHGLAAGVDISPDQIAAAARACAEAPAVVAEVGDMRALDRPDAVFDAAVAVQALEYVEDVGTVLGELARVVKPGGRLVCLATNWHSAFWHGPDADLTAEITAAWDSHAPHPNLPARLPAMLAAAGFGEIGQFPVPVVDSELDPESFAWWIARLMAAHAVTEGVPEARAQGWISALERAQAEGAFFFSMVPILTLAQRPAQPCETRLHALD